MAMASMEEKHFRVCRVKKKKSAPNRRFDCMVFAAGVEFRWPEVKRPLVNNAGVAA